MYSIIFVNESNIPYASKWNVYQPYKNVFLCYFMADCFSARYILQEIQYL